MKTTIRLLALFAAFATAHAIDFPIDNAVAVPGKTTIGVKSPLAFTQQSTPSAPATGGILFVNNLDQLKFRTSGGTITLDGSGGGTGTSTAILMGDGSGGFDEVTIGGALSFSTGTLNVGAGGITNTMLAGSIASTKLASANLQALSDIPPGQAGLGILQTTPISENGFVKVFDDGSATIIDALQLLSELDDDLVDLADGSLTGTKVGAGIAAGNITSGTLANARTTATNANTASAIVARDGSGNFTAGTITATLSGNASTATTLATLDTTFYAADAGANDTYTATLAPAPGSYVTGAHYRFKANTANTGAATINFNGLGAKTIKKAAGGITTDLADNDIRAGQWVDLSYDGTNMQMQSLLGNAPGGGGGGTPAGASTQVQYNDSGSFAGSADFTFDGSDVNVVTGYKVGGTRVVQSQQGAIGDASGSTAGMGADTVDIATLDSALSDHLAKINAILAALRAHGLISP